MTKSKPAHLAVAEEELYKLDPADIVVDIVHDERSLGISKDEIAELAESILARGQLQAIGVTLFGAPAGKYRLVFGRRRLLAIRHLGNRPVEARMLAVTSDEHLEDLRAIENFHRAELNPVEQARVVSRVLDQERKTLGIQRDADDVPDGSQRLPDALVSAAATRLGVSVKQVRDLAYVDRLAEPVKKLMLDGCLPVAHARALAKIADPDVQEDLANTAAGDPESGDPPMALHRFENMVGFHRMSLKVVPWDPAVPFAGKPACTACPNNSANDRQLFMSADAEAGDEVPRLCHFKACFAHKEREAEKAIKRRLDAAVKACTPAKKGEDAKCAPTPAALAKFIPEGVKPTTFANRVRKRVGPEAAPGAKPKGKASPSGWLDLRNTPEEKAKRAHADALGSWERKRGDAVERLCAGDAMRAVCHLVAGAIESRKTMHNYKVKGKPPTAEALARMVAERDVAGLSLELVRDPKYIEAIDYWGTPEEFEACLAKGLGVDVGPEPQLKDFLPAKDPAPAKAKAHAAGTKKGSKKKAKKKAKKSP